MHENRDSELTKPLSFHDHAEPSLEGPSDLKRGVHIPYCKVEWRPIKDENSDGYSWVKVYVNTQEKTIVGLYLAFARTNVLGPTLKVEGIIRLGYY